MSNQNKALYIFLDEGGNFDFSPKGTQYFTLTSFLQTRPFILNERIENLKFDLIESRKDIEYFHASEDIQHVRNNVFSLLSQLNHPLRVDSVIAQKNKTNPTLHKQPLEFYKIIAEALLKYAFNRAIWHDYDHVVVVFSSLFDRKKRGILKQAFKYLIKQHAKVSFALYFHDSKFDICNQAADYFGWAIYRKWDSNDTRSYVLVQHLIKSEFNIFEKGGREFYDYKN